MPQPADTTFRQLPSGGLLAARVRRPREADPALISLVVPMYNERNGLDSLFAAIEAALAGTASGYEVLCIDDGSTDGTFEALRERGDPRIRACRFSRNYGKEAALTAGIDLAEGDVVIPLDADLQDPPSVIPDMIAKWREGYDVVTAVRRTRDADSFMKSASAGLFYTTFNMLCSPKIPPNAGDFRLLDRRVVEVLRHLPERNRFMKGILSWPGFTSATVLFDRAGRRSGTGKWKIAGLFGLAVNGITSFSSLPLRAASLLGGGIALLAFAYCVVVVFKKLLFGDAIQGYASLMAVMLLLGGVQLFSLGIIGEYIGRIYVEAKKRPQYVISEIFGSGGERAPEGKSADGANAEAPDGKDGGPENA